MANDLDDLDGAKGDPQRRRAASWSSSTSGTQPSCRHHGRNIGPPLWPAPPAATSTS